MKKVRQDPGVGSYSPDCAVYILPLQENALRVKIASHCRSLWTSRCGRWKDTAPCTSRKLIRMGKPAPVTGVAGVSEACSIVGDRLRAQASKTTGSGKTPESQHQQCLRMRRPKALESSCGSHRTRLTRHRKHSKLQDS